MSKPKLGIVIGSIRPNRFGGHAAQWIEEIARRRTDFEVELIDLKDYPMPLFAEEASPLYAPSKNEVAQRWQRQLAREVDEPSIDDELDRILGKPQD